MFDVNVKFYKNNEVVLESDGTNVGLELVNYFQRLPYRKKYKLFSK